MINVVQLLSLATVLYSVGAYLTAVAPFWNPLGYLVLACSMTTLYQTGVVCCASTTAMKGFSANVHQVIGQASHLLLLRPLQSSISDRAPKSNGSRVLNNEHVAWCAHKVRAAWSLTKLTSSFQAQGLSHPKVRACIELATVIFFASIFFPILLVQHGLSGVIRFWLLPFILMHVQLGSFNLNGIKTMAAMRFATRVINYVCSVHYSYSASASEVDEKEAETGSAATTSQGKKNVTLREGFHWFNVIYLTIVHIGGYYGARMCTSSPWKTIIFSVFLAHVGGFGITAGAHRLWAHRSYSATLGTRVAIMLCNTVANEGTVLKWARDHRVHHKHVDTPKDPHDATKGFFWSHMGWLLYHKSKLTLDAGKKVFMDDLYADEVVMWQHRNPWVNPLVCFVMPTLVCSLWGDLMGGLLVAGCLRYLFTLHSTWCVNSVAHLFGDRPYVADMLPAENLIVSIMAMGEGWHNYHHAYPYDYSANEHGVLQWNPTTGILDSLAYFGKVFDRRRAKLTAPGERLSEEELPEYSVETVKAMANQAAKVTMLDGYVYDLTEFADKDLHPGGSRILRAYYGKDCTKAFRGGVHAHTVAADNLLADYRIGKLSKQEQIEFRENKQE